MLLAGGQDIWQWTQTEMQEIAPKYKRDFFFFFRVIYQYNGLQTETCKESRVVPQVIHYQADGRRVYRSTLTFPMKQADETGNGMGVPVI